MTSPDPKESSPPRPAPAAAVPNRTTDAGSEAIRQFMVKTGDLSQRGVKQWRSQAVALSEGASAHIRAHPLRSVVVAASTGVLLALMLRALNR